jgi:hypothetical protein
MTTRRHVSTSREAERFFFHKKVKKRNKKTQLKEESNLLAKNEKN